MKFHTLKCRQPHYGQIIAGEKTAELRYDDRGFSAGDVLILQEIRFVNHDQYFTGHICYVGVKGITIYTEALREGWVMMSVSEPYLYRFEPLLQNKLAYEPTPQGNKTK